MQVQVRDFFEWRNHAHEFYENLTMFVLPRHPISLNFTRKTVFAGDSSVFGLIMGLPGADPRPPAVTLYNVLFPNRHSTLFDKSHPNKAWGRVTPIRELRLSSTLRAVGVSRANDVLAATDTGLTLYTALGERQIEGTGSTSLIEFAPVDYDPHAFVCTDTGHVLQLTAGATSLTPVAEFKRPVIDMTVDPYRPTCALLAQGKTHVHMLDSRDARPVDVKLAEHTSAVEFAPEMPFMFATGHLSGHVAVYDIRNTGAAIVSIADHDSAVTSLRWSPHNRDIVASASLDTAIALWSIRDPETSVRPVFTHNGHVAPIVAFDWCKDVPWTLASVSEDNLFEFWTIASSQLEDYLFAV